MTEQTIETKHEPAMTEDFEGGTEAMDALTAEMRSIEAQGPDIGPMPQRMAASRLYEAELFQVRAGISAYHVESLSRSLAQDGDLQPLLVLRRGGKAYLIDGRHRLRAYEQARRGNSVPVAEFFGTPQEALLEGQRLNKRHTLAMTQDERMDCAWKLVKLDAAGACRFTLPQITAVGVSRGQVTFMRKVLRELGEPGFEHVRWKVALRMHNGKSGREYTEEEMEDMNDTDGREAADKFARIYGTRLADRPEAMARMIEYYTGRRIGEVVRILNERNASSFDDADEDEFLDF